MQITHILLLAGAALALRLAPPAPRRWLVFAASALCLYALQPALPIRGLGYWLPTATLGLAALGWLLTAPAEERLTRANGLAAGLLAGIALLAGLTRYLGSGLLPAVPPPLGQVAAGLALLAGLLGGAALLLRARNVPERLLGAAALALIALLVALKTPALALEAARGLRAAAGQNPDLAAALDVRWLGFSYIVFRLIHTLRDRQSGRLPRVGLRDYLSYVTFFPALAAGPIDRLERFQNDLEAVSDLPGDLAEGGRRLTLGLLKKFALADTLGLVALSPSNALQVREPGWMWLLLYLYALQIFFDFSGYTDIAIGSARLLGIRLPENFAAPYLKPNLTQFWNAWHISLTQWFRGYFFNPLVRALRGRRAGLSPALVMLLAQTATMLLIGLWHGVTLNFALWGLWHGLGLFAQNRWSEFTRSRAAGRGGTAGRERTAGQTMLADIFSPVARRAQRVLSVLLTFHYVALGWVFFLLPTPQAAGQVFLKLFGLSF